MSAMLLLNILLITLLPLRAATPGIPASAETATSITEKSFAGFAGNSVIGATSAIAATSAKSETSATQATPATPDGMTGTDTTTRILFKDLRKFRMGDTRPPEEIEKLNGQTVAIVGYMVPFDSIENIDKFVLLQAPFMGCYHVPPPQPNESLMIFSSNQRVDYTYEPILITGTLVVEDSYVESYLVSRYTIKATNVRRADMRDAELEGLPVDFHFGGDF